MLATLRSWLGLTAPVRAREAVEPVEPVSEGNESVVRMGDPDLIQRRNVDSNGRVYLGKAWSGDRIELVVKRIDQDGEAA